MKFSLPLCLLFLSVTAIFSGCSESGSVKSKEVVLEEKTENLADGVVLTDKEEEETQKSQDNANRQPAVEPTKVLSDKSELVTMFDGYGNKTESRYFKGHPRLQLITVRTAADGMKQVIVYGYGSDVKMMGEEFAEKALTATATELANAADLKITRPYKDAFSRSAATPPQTSTPVQTRQVKPVQPVQTTVEATRQTSGVEEKIEPQNPPDEMENRQLNEENQR